MKWMRTLAISSLLIAPLALPADAAAGSGYFSGIFDGDKFAKRSHKRWKKSRNELRKNGERYSKLARKTTKNTGKNLRQAMKRSDKQLRKAMKRWPGRR